MQAFAFNKARKHLGKLALLALVPFMLLAGIISAIAGSSAGAAAACQVAASGGTYVDVPIPAGAGVPAAATTLLDPAQVAFVNALVTQTHINGTLAVAWVLAEQGGIGSSGVQSYLNGAVFYPGRSEDIGIPFNDWLNVGIPSVSGAEGVTNQQWNDPTTAGTYTGKWLQGAWNDPPWGSAAAKIQAFANAAPTEGVAAQISQLQQSGWASSGYPALVSDYDTVINAEHGTGTTPATGTQQAQQLAAPQTVDVADTITQPTTTGSGAATGSAPTVDKTAANTYLTRLNGDPEVGYAIVGANGQVLGSHKDTLTVNSSSITRAMLLVAYLREHPTAAITGNPNTQLTAMTDKASTTAGNWVFQQVGAAAVTKVATDAGMSSFHLDTNGTPFVLAQSTVDALDFARFFSKIDQLIPAGQRTYAMGLLSSLSNQDQWGILDAGVTGITASQAGWQAEADGQWTVNQAAQIASTPWGTVGIAIVSQDDGTGKGGLAQGEEIMSNVTSDLLDATSVDASGYGINLSQLSGEQQQEVQNAAQQVQQDNPADCTNVSQSTGLPTVPGSTAQIDSSTGIASAPTDLPASIKPTIDALIAAGNQIHTLPYIWGGGHGVNLNELQPGYDCSGSTSYDLFKAGLLTSPYALVSGDYEKWGQPGPGKYITIFSNSTHVFIAVDGIVMDTAWYSSVSPTHPSSGPRWQPASMIQAQINGDEADGGGGFVETHPAGL